MPWRGHNRRSCRICGRVREDGEAFSARGKCPGCGNGRMIENVRAMEAHSGPNWLAWRRGMAASVGATILDGKREQG